MKNLGMLALALFMLVGCAGTGANAEAVSPTPPTLMVATKLQTPLYIVLDPTRVKPAYEAARIGTVSNMGAFVTRDIKGLMSNYFETVHIVANASEISEEIYVVVDVKVDGFEKHSAPFNGGTASVWDMTWNFALRPSDSPDYVFSFAGIARSKTGVKGWNDALDSILEEALTGLLAEWAEAGTFGALQSWESKPAE